MCALFQIVTWSNHTHCYLVLLFPHMLSFGISPCLQTSDFVLGTWLCLSFHSVFDTQLLIISD